MLPLRAISLAPVAVDPGPGGTVPGVAGCLSSTSLAEPSCSSTSAPANPRTVSRTFFYKKNYI
jgi:hypothetical protein